MADMNDFLKPAVSLPERIVTGIGLAGMLGWFSIQVWLYYSTTHMASTREQVSLHTSEFWIVAGLSVSWMAANLFWRDHLKQRRSRELGLR